MQFGTILTALVAITLCTGYFAAAKVDNATAITSPACFTTCAAKTAIQVGCSGIADLACYCTKEDFVLANARCSMESCPDIAMNTTLTTASFKSLEALCKKAIGAKNFTLTIPTAAQLGMSTNASMTASTSGSKANTASTSTDAAASLLQPPIAHIISASLVLSVLVAGSSLLL